MASCKNDFFLHPVHTKQISFFRPNKEVVLWEGLARVTHLNVSHHRTSYLKDIVTIQSPHRLDPAECFRSSYIGE